MVPLQKLVLDQGSSWGSSFHIRPSSLFTGVAQRLTVILMGAAGDKKVFLLGAYRRWLEEERSTLLNQIEYVGVASSTIKLGDFPKVATPLELSIISKLQGFPISSFETEEHDRPLYVHRIVQYFVKAVDFVPFFWNEAEGQKKSEDYKPFYFKPDLIDAFTAILSSSTFYWFWYIFGDGFHCGYRDVRAFGLKRHPDDNTLASLSRLGKELMVDLKKHASRRVTVSKATGRVEYDEFYLKLSKPIIDEIDKVLARHYGFTDEELDFIINYNIKYRMGQNGDEGDDEA
jgi:hypothetical protein